tara:strand:+ start:261 stop:938 length:678 start_codon:yes stop_codon:yes gene_type:complete
MSLFPVYSPTSQEPFAQSFLSSAVVAAPNASVFTYSSVSLGAAAADRYILVGTSGAAAVVATATISSITIGGVSATSLIQINHHDETLYHSGFFGVVVPSGTSGDIVVTWTTTMSQNGIGVWRLTGANTTPHDSAGDTQDAGGLTVDVDVEAGGAIFGYCSTDSLAAGRFNWTGLTEDFDEDVDPGWQHSGASADFASAVTNQTVTVTGAGVSREGLMGISFSPA